MKKRVLLLSVCMAVSMMFTGCTGTGKKSEVDSATNGDEKTSSETVGDEVNEDAGNPSASLKKQNLTLATGSTGGTYYALGGAMATVWTDAVEPLTISAISTGASTENMNLINAGEADLGIAMNSIADDCWNGAGAFAETGSKQNFKTIGVVYPEVFQIVADANKGATTLSELKGLNIAIGPVGSGTASASEIVFEAAGMDINKDIKAQRDSFSDATAKMQDGLLDGSCAVLAVPASAITELETAKDISFININDNELAAIQKKFPYYTRFIIPAGTYSNKEDILTVTCQAALYCRPDMDEETVYYITKEMYENKDKIEQAHTAGQYISLETALDGITTPLHPGAIKYYEEKGITVPDSLK